MKTNFYKGVKINHTCDLDHCINFIDCDLEGGEDVSEIWEINGWFAHKYKNRDEYCVINCNTLFVSKDLNEAIEYIKSNNLH